MSHQIEGYLDKLRQLALTRDQTEFEMGKLHLAIRGLCNLIDDPAEREAYKAVLETYSIRTGLTDLVLLCLNISDKPLTPGDIRDFIVNYGSEVGVQQNLLQSVHTTLRRLEETGKVKQEIITDGETAEKAYRRVSIRERLAQRGVEVSDANRVGDRMEKRFDQMFGHAFALWGSKPVSMATLLPDKSQPAENTGSRMLDIVKQRKAKNSK